MKKEKGKEYEPEFKLRLAKEYLETDKTLEEVAQENGISSKTPFFQARPEARGKR